MLSAVKNRCTELRLVALVLPAHLNNSCPHPPAKIIELVIVRDKATLEHKGSAFVWFAERKASERAVLQLNLRHVLSDDSGEQDRPLVVRRAKPRAKRGIAAALQNYSPSLSSPLPGPPSLMTYNEALQQQVGEAVLVGWFFPLNI